MERRKSPQETRLSVRMNPDDFMSAIIEGERKASFADRFILGAYSLEDLEALISKHPGMLDAYGDYMLKHRDVAAVAALFEGVPAYAERLRPIFDGRPRLLETYASFALTELGGVGEEGRKKDEPLRTYLGVTRLSTSTNLAVIESHLAQVAEWERMLRTKLEGKSHREWLIFGGVAKLLLGVINNPDPETSGVRIRLSLADTKAYDFWSHEVNLSQAGELDSGAHARDYQNFGYLPRGGQVDERRLIEAFVIHDLDTQIFIDAIEDAASGIE